MLLEAAKPSIEREEGRINYIYLDHLGHKTFGVGHLVTESDPEYGQDCNTFVSEERINECFEKDVKKAIRGAKKICKLDNHPLAIQVVLVNMVFQMGEAGVRKFKKFLSFLEKKDYKKASVEMMDSRWASQTFFRARRMANIVKSFA